MDTKFLFNNEEATCATCFTLRNSENVIENVTLVGQDAIDITHNMNDEVNPILQTYPTLQVVDEAFLTDKLEALEHLKKKQEADKKAADDKAAKAEAQEKEDAKKAKK